MARKKATTDWYEKLPKKYKESSHNPNYKYHHISLPFRALIVGSSGSGKTTLVFELLKQINKTFEHIVLCIKNKDEPLYQWLKDGLGGRITIYENGVIPNIEEVNPDKQQILMIFDDLVNEPKSTQSKITEYYIRGRKMNISMIYLTQSYYKTPKTIRINCNYIFIKKLSAMKDLKMICSEYTIDRSLKELLKEYENATDNKLDFLLIDLHTNDNRLRVRKNFG